MPAGAVYVVAIVGTIGAAIAFKHFVLDPHVRPAVGRWIEAFRQNQRRRGAPVEAADTDELEVLMRERHRSSNTNSHESDDDGENDIFHPSTSSHEQGRRFRVRGTGRSGHERMSSSSIELDNLVASEWRHEIANSSGQDLRPRRPAPSDLLNESVSSIPYVPFSPRRTHVLANSLSPSPAIPSVMNRLPTPPTSPVLVSMAGGDVQNLPSPPKTPTSTWITSLSGSDEVLYSHSSGGSPIQPDSPERQLPLMEKTSKTRATSGRGEVLTAAGGSSLSPLTCVSLPRLSPPPSSAGEASVNASPYLQHRNVPSLSQSYPQDLDAEHGLELLSAPSSRADSPFSLADISPRPPMVNILDRNRALNESIGNGSGGSVDLSPARIPSRTFMNLDNESFATLSPAVGPRQLALRAAGVGVDAGNHLQRRTSPLAPGQRLEPPTTNEPGVTTPQSMTNSAKSTTYMSFSEDEDDVPLAVRRASLISNSSNPPRRSQGLGLTFIPPIENPSSDLDPVTAAPAPLSASDMLSPHPQLVQVSTLPPSVSQLNSERGQALSDSDLSELDLMSDFAPSEGDLVVIDSPTAGAAALVINNNNNNNNNNNGAGAADNDNGQQTQTHMQRGGHAHESDLESDAGWSLAGGSDVGSGTSAPQSPQSRSGASGYLTRGGTLRARH